MAMVLPLAVLAPIACEPSRDGGGSSSGAPAPIRADEPSPGDRVLTYKDIGTVIVHADGSTTRLGFAATSGTSSESSEHQGCPSDAEPQREQPPPPRPR